MIQNIEQNKFLNPEYFKEMNGIWIVGEGVLFTTIAQAEKHYTDNKSPNECNPILREVNYNGQVYYQKIATNSFD